MRTHTPGSLALDGDHEHAFTVRHDLFANLGRLRAEIRTSNNAELDDSIDNEREAYGELLVTDKPGRAVYGVLLLGTSVNYLQ